MALQVCPKEAWGVLMCPPQLLMQNMSLATLLAISLQVSTATEEPTPLISCPTTPATHRPSSGTKWRHYSPNWAATCLWPPSWPFPFRCLLLQRNLPLWFPVQLLQQHTGPPQELNGDTIHPTGQQHVSGHPPGHFPSGVYCYRGTYPFDFLSNYSSNTQALE